MNQMPRQMDIQDIIHQPQLSFNYDTVPEPVAVQAREAAQRIKLRLRRSAEDIIEIGRDLLAVKDRIGHGNFLAWLDAEFSMAERTARKFMEVAKVYGSKSAQYADLQPQALYELAAPKTPLEVREEIERMIEAGEVVTKATVTKLKEEAEAAKKDKELADQDAEAAEEKIATLQSEADEAIAAEVQKAADKIKAAYDAEIKRLSAEITELRKPAPVIHHEPTDNVVSLHKNLTQAQKDEIDAENDEDADADFIQSASDMDKAVAFFGSIRNIAKVKAPTKAVLQYIKTGRSPELVAEFMAMVDQAFSQIKAVKDQSNG